MRRSPRGCFLAVGLALIASPLKAQSSTWDPLPSFVPVANPGAVYDPLRDRIVMFGGYFTQRGSGRSRETREWDGSRWLARRPLVSPPTRACAGMTFDYIRGKAILFGGNLVQEGIIGSTSLNDMWEYDGQTWQQIPQVGAWPRARIYPGMGCDPVRGKILLFGGDDYVNSVTFADTWEWDGQSWQQLFPATQPTRRYGASMAYCYTSQKVIMLGGGPGLQIDYLYQWDGTDWTDLSNRPGNPPGYSGILVSTPWNGHVIRQFAVGVQNNTNVFYNDTWDFDGTSWTQLPTTNRPCMRGGANLCEFPSTQTILLANGENFVGPYPPHVFGTDPTDREEDPWVLENGDWHHIHTDVRSGFPIQAATYDPVQGRTVVVANRNFWASSIGEQMETWALEGDKLRRLSLATNPPYRVNPRMVRHPGQGKIVLFGGSRYPQNLPQDTWVFDGSQWVEDTSTQAVMPNTFSESMVYDGARDQVVLMFYNRPDLWAWNGHGWSTWAAGQLPFQPFGILGYDPARHRLVYYGDLRLPSSIILRDQLYEFDGVSWQQVPVAAIPSTDMQWTHLVYVPWLGGLVLVPKEGYCGAGPVGGPVWVWDGVSWSTSPVDRDMFDGLRAYNTGTRAGATYDAARGELQVFSPENDTFATGSYVWRLKRLTLRLSTHHPRLTERLALSFDAPAQAGRLGVVLISGANFPGIPIGAVDGRSLPLANGVMLQTSVGLGLWTMLDAQGHGTLQLGAIPNDPRLVGMGFYAAGVVLNPSNATVSTATNSQPFDVNR